MKIRSAVIVLYALLPMSSDVSAKTPSHGTIHHQHPPHRFDHTLDMPLLRLGEPKSHISSIQTLIVIFLDRIQIAAAAGEVSA
jgi:hypothetical protein